MVSCILTTCNRLPEVFLRAFRSVIFQEYVNIEVIVINDSPHFEYCSTIRAIVNDYKHIVSFPLYYYENSKNKGANYSRNRGIYYSHGDFIAFLDDDDEWMPDKLNSIMALFNDSDVGLVYSDYHRITLNNEKINVFKAHRKGFVFNELLAHNIIGPTSGVVIRRECVNQCGFFDNNFPARQDYDLWLRISQHYKVSHVKKFLYIYHDSKSSISTDVKKRIKGRELILRKYHLLYSQNRNAYRYTLMEYFFEMLLNKRYFRALKILLSIITKTHPNLNELQVLCRWMNCAIAKKNIDHLEFY